MNHDRVQIRGERNHAAICPFCREGAQGLVALACPDCGTRYHRACAEEMGGCATLGCRGAEIGRLRLRMRWRDEDRHGFLARWDRPASERPTVRPPVEAAPAEERLSLLRLAWIQLDGLRFLVGVVLGLLVLLLTARLPVREEVTRWGLVAVGLLGLAYFSLSGGYAANPWWWPTRRREWWE